MTTTYSNSYRHYNAFSLYMKQRKNYAVRAGIENKWLYIRREWAAHFDINCAGSVP